MAIPSGESSATVDNIFFSKIPKRVIIGFVKSTAFNGDYTLNPFNFDNFNVKYMCLTIDGSCMPSRAIQTDFSSDSFLDAYDTLFSIAQDEETGKPRKTTSITRGEYKSGHFLTVFNIDGSSVGSETINPQTVGLSKLEIKFASALSSGVTIILYSTYNSLLRIDEARNVNVTG